MIGEGRNHAGFSLIIGLLYHALTLEYLTHLFFLSFFLRNRRFYFSFFMLDVGDDTNRHRGCPFFSKTIGRFIKFLYKIYNILCMYTLLSPWSVSVVCVRPFLALFNSLYHIFILRSYTNRRFVFLGRQVMSRILWLVLPRRKLMLFEEHVWIPCRGEGVVLSCTEGVGHLDLQPEWSWYVNRDRLIRDPSLVTRLILEIPVE